MTDAVIVDAVRTAGGKRNGKLRNWHAADLASEPLKALVERNDLDPALVDDVIMGCVMQVGRAGAQRGSQRGTGRRLPRVGARHHRRPPVRFLSAGPPLRRPGRHRRRLRRGHRRRCRGHDPHPDGLVGRPRARVPVRPEDDGRYADRGGLVGQGEGAELIAEQWGISREDLDAFSVRSHQRAARATAEGRFEREIIPVRDQGRRAATTPTS